MTKDELAHCIELVDNGNNPVNIYIPKSYKGKINSFCTLIRRHSKYYVTIATWDKAKRIIQVKKGATK